MTNSNYLNYDLGFSVRPGTRVPSPNRRTLMTSLASRPGRTARAYAELLPGERILGLSTLARVVTHFAARPQVQERLTKQVAQWLDENLHPRGVGEILAAEHTCMTLRAARAPGTSTVTSTLLGRLRSDPGARQDLFALTQRRA
jgi:GTP cyclohydrolase I